MVYVPAGFPEVPPPAGSAERADEVRVAFAGPAAQRRLTVFFRLIMVIPHLVVLYALSIAAEILVIICWFAALFTGRLPDGLAHFLSGYLRWYTRVYAYAWLLTDEYPPFALDDDAYPVRFAVTPGPLNRLAVLFRIFLAIPASIVSALAAGGAGAASLVTWLIVLITGRMPDSLYQALAAILRYYIRFQAYSYLLTSTYPAALFGDQPAAGLPTAAGPEATPWPSPAGYGEPGGTQPEASPPAYDQPGYTPPAYDQPGFAPPAYDQPGFAPPAYDQPGFAPPAYDQPGYAQPGYAQPGYGEPPAYAAPGVPAPAAADWRLVLSSRARKLVGFFIALGAVGIAAYIVVITVVVGSAASRVNAVNQVSRAHSSLVNAISRLQTATTACQGNLSCVTRQDSNAAGSFLAFNSTLNSTAMPDSASTAARQKLAKDTTGIAADFQSLSHATSAGQYQQTLASSGLQQALNQFDTDYQQLGVALGAVNG